MKGRVATGRWRTALALLATGAALPGCPKPRPPAARVALAGRSHDFGALWIGEIVRHPFRVENRGELVLELGEVRSTCGCLLHELSARRIEPGRSAEIVAELHADKGPGPLEKKLRIGTNDPDCRWLELTLKAELRTLYALEPPLVDAQDLVLGEPRELVVKLAVQDGSSIELGQPICPDPGFSASVRDASRSGGEVVIRFDGATATGRRLFKVEVPTGHPRVPVATLPVQAVVLPRLTVERTDRIDFGSIARPLGASAELTLRNRGREPIAATPVAEVKLAEPRADEAGRRPESPSVTATIEPVQPGSEWKLRVQVAPGSAGSSIVGRVMVRLDAPSEPVQAIVLSGRIVD